MLTSGSHTCKQSRTLWELKAKVSLGHTDPKMVKIRIQRGGVGWGKAESRLVLEETKPVKGSAWKNPT